MDYWNKCEKCWETEYLRELLTWMVPCRLKQWVFDILRWYRKIEHFEYHCPCCGWEPPEPDGSNDHPVEFSNTWRYGEYGSGTGWTETWTCDCCGTVFQFDNGDS